MRLMLFVFAFLLLCNPWQSGLLRADDGDFDWGWEELLLEEESALDPAVIDVSEAAPAVPQDDTLDPVAEFDFSWEGHEELELDEPAREAPVAVTPRPADVTARGIDPAAYDELLNENLALRSEIERLQAEAAANANKAREQSGRITALESSLTAALAQLETVQDSARSESAVVEELRAEKAVIQQSLENRTAEVDAMKQQLSGMSESLEETRRMLEQARAERAPAGPAIGPGSDLFQSIQRENESLKQKVVELEAARRRLQQERDDALARVSNLERSEKAAQEKIKENEAAVRGLKETVARLAEQIPEFQKKIAGLEETIAGKDAELAARQQAISGLMAELSERDRRIEKAERTARVLEKAREKVQQMGANELRDMHYNMAAVYARDGRFREAEQSYLKALRIDPADSDVHFNLGILYDDHLNNKRRAAMHYRRYLQLRPSGADSDRVRQWLLAIEMAQ